MSNLPDRFMKLPLKDLAKDFVVPMRDRPKRFEGETPWIRIEDFDGKWVSRSKSNLCVDEETIREMNLKIHPSGTVLCSCSANLGVCAITSVPLITNQTFIGIVPDESKTDKEFLYYLMSSKAQELQRLSSGTTIAYLPRQKFEDFEVEIPSLPEQKKIAEILSRIDETIEAKELALRKHQVLLQATKEESMSRTADWQQYELGELLLFRNGLNTEKSNFGAGVPFVAYKDVNSGGVITAKRLMQKVSLAAAEEERFLLRNGDILFTRTSETPEEIGFSCVFDDQDGGAVFNGFSIRGRPKNSEILIPEFSSFYFRSEPVLSQMRYLCKYTTRAGISAESLSKVKVCIPNPSTQRKIADSLIAFSDLIRRLNKSIRALQNLKASLSEDLISGRKRVSV